MLPKRFIVSLAMTVMVTLSFAAFISCGGSGSTTPDGIITVRHNSEDFPSGLKHMHYSGYDGNGNRIYISTEYPVSEAHILSDVPGNVTAMVIEYHTDTEEKLSKSVQPIAFTNGSCLWSPQYYGPQFDPKRLAVVDISDGNILVRGNLPLVTNNGKNPCLPGQKHCFAYSELNTRMKEMIPDFDIEKYEIIDFSLIDNQGTKDELTAEINALGMRGLEDIDCGTHWPPYNGGCVWDPKKTYASKTDEKKPGGFVWWPVYACNNKDRPCNTTDTDIALNKFHFIDASLHLKTLLTTPSEKKRLVYFHCMQGTDRTGALHIAYIMDNNPDITFEEAVRKATIGAKQGSNDQQLDPPLVPMCSYVGQAYRYCLEKNKSNPGRCDMPGGFNEGATLCRP